MSVSALPYAQSLQSLELDDNWVGPTWMLTEYERRWLAHAFFHPRTKTAI